ncbi:MAG: T9SS type A sorting domain-containing protein, partial [Bacteroidetes bacterium]|nr:T9SS type A sorting domain-containing protein [Bacteroidota bacterium]
IQFSLINTGLKVYPNPNDGNFQIDYQLSEGQKGELTIFNIMGKKLFTYPLVNETDNLKIRKSDVLKNGLYFYQIIINNNIVKREKLLIMAY